MFLFLFIFLIDAINYDCMTLYTLESILMHGKLIFKFLYIITTDHHLL